MRVMQMAKEEFEKGNLLICYICKYRRRLQFKKAPKNKTTHFNFMKYYVFENGDCNGDNRKD